MLTWPNRFTFALSTLILISCSLHGAYAEAPDAAVRMAVEQRFKAIQSIVVEYDVESQALIFPS